MWQLSKANRLKMFVFYNCDTHFPGGGVKALFTVCLTHIFHKDCVCVCVFWSKEVRKDLSWGFVLCVYVQCVYVPYQILFLKATAFGFMCAKQPLGCGFFFFPCCVPKCDPDRISCANYSLEEILCIELLRYFDSTCIYCIFCSSTKVSAYWIIK